MDLTLIDRQLEELAERSEAELAEVVERAQRVAHGIDVDGAIAELATTAAGPNAAFEGLTSPSAVAAVAVEPVAAATPAPVESEPRQDELIEASGVTAREDYPAWSESDVEVPSGMVQLPEAQLRRAKLPPVLALEGRHEEEAVEASGTVERHPFADSVAPSPPQRSPAPPPPPPPAPPAEGDNIEGMSVDELFGDVAMGGGDPNSITVLLDEEPRIRESDLDALESELSEEPELLVDFDLPAAGEGFEADEATIAQVPAEELLAMEAVPETHGEASNEEDTDGFELFVDDLDIEIVEEDF